MYELLLKEANKYFSEKEVILIKKAYLFAKDLHKGQKRASGEPYIIHPLNVAYILLTEMHLHDANSICAAFLHDTIEDTGITKEFLEIHFNYDVANLVASVSKIKDLNFSSQTEEEQYNTCVLLRSLMNDYRVIFIKLADRLHNMRTLSFKNPKKQKEKSEETIKLFVPLASQVGALLIKNELQELSFKYLNPRRYKEIKSNVNHYILEHQFEIEDVLATIENTLLKHNINHDIRMRTKNVYDIHCSLKPKQKLSSIPDLISYEIVVDDLKDCYLTLGYLHQIYHPVTGSIVDYIATSDENEYRGIHTIVNGLRQHPIELRIQNNTMALINKHGLAVLQDKYPEKSIEQIKLELSKNNKFLNALQSIDLLYKNDYEFMEQVTNEILAKQIKVFSKDGDIYSLPKGSTVLDFAFKVHTDIGYQAIGALVNNKEVAINYVLKDNDSICILINEEQICQDDSALEFVVTAKAKKKIRERIIDVKKKSLKRFKVK